MGWRILEREFTAKGSSCQSKKKNENITNSTSLSMWASEDDQQEAQILSREEFDMRQ